MDARRTWRKLSGCTVLVLALGAVLGCSGQKPATSESPSTSPAAAASYDADVKELFVATGSDSVALQVASYISDTIISAIAIQRTDVTEKQVAAAKEEVNAFLAERVPELMDKMSGIYKKHFTHDDIRTLVAFFRTPVGMKFARLTPTVSREGARIGEQWGRELGPELGQRLIARLEKEGVKIQ